MRASFISGNGVPRAFAQHHRVRGAYPVRAAKSTIGAEPDSLAPPVSLGGEEPSKSLPADATVTGNVNIPSPHSSASDPSGVSVETTTDEISSETLAQEPSSESEPAQPEKQSEEWTGAAESVKDDEPAEAKHIDPEDFPYKVGDVVTGRVLFGNNRGARIAMHGVKGVMGYLPKNRGPYCLRDPRQRNNYTSSSQILPQGTTRRFKVIAVPPDMTIGGKGPLLACSDLDISLLWKRLGQVKELGSSMRETIRVACYATTDRGLLVSLFGIKGFMPVSHVIKEEGQEWLAREDLEKWVGQDIEASLMNVDPSRNTFTCSMVNGASDRIVRSLRIGTLLWGTVRQMKDYGVFVSIDGTFESALLHITNVSWHRVPTIDSVFSEGDRVRAVVIGMDEGYSRLSVSTRDLEEQEGDMLTDPQKVYDNAESGVQRFLEHVRKWEAEQASGEGDGN